MSDNSLVGKTAIITGAGSGLGRSMTLALAQAGTRVGAVDIVPERLDELKRDVGNAEVLPICANLCEPERCLEVVENTVSAFGTVDALINSAGVSLSIIRPNFRREKVMFWEVPDDKWHEMFDINITAPFMLAKAVVPHMLTKGWGRIVNVTTSLDTMIRPSWTPYGPSKAALEAASSNWAGDLEGTGITVNVLIPGGPANTNFVPDVTDEERRKLVQPELMGPPIKWLLSTQSDKVTAKRFLATNWDDSLPPEEAAERASAPIAWKSLGRQAATEPVPI